MINVKLGEVKIAHKPLRLFYPEAVTQAQERIRKVDAINDVFRAVNAWAYGYEVDEVPDTEKTV